METWHPGSHRRGHGELLLSFLTLLFLALRSWCPSTCGYVGIILHVALSTPVFFIGYNTFACQGSPLSASSLGLRHPQSLAGLLQLQQHLLRVCVHGVHECG